MGKMMHSEIPSGGIHSNLRQRGAKRGPIHKIFAAPWHEAHAAPPDEIVIIPPHMSMEGNDQYGVCVTAEEAAAKQAYSVYCGLTETYISDAETVAWATRYGFRDGAELAPVMDQMAKTGLTANGQEYKDGPYKVVDYTDETNLKSALAIGPVKIGIDANALSPGAGNGNGWFSVGGTPGEYQNEDHCVSIFGYCKASTFFQKLGKPVPSGINSSKVGYILYTWGGVGYVDHEWLMSTCQEAYVRYPTTIGQSPNPSPPSPPVPPVPPVPVTHPVVTIPDQQVSFHNWLIGTVSLTVHGGTYPVTQVQGGPLGHAPWLKIMLDAGKVATDVATQNWLALPGDLATLAADFRAAQADHGRLGVVWGQLFQDVLKIVTDFEANAPIQTLIEDGKAIARDFGINV